MLNRILSLIGAALFPLLCLKCLSDHGSVIQGGVKNLTETALKGAGLNDVSVIADGRDVTLRGYVESDLAKTKAGTTAALALGVRSVDNELVVVTKQAIQTKLNDLLLRKKIEFETGKDVLLKTSVPVLEEALAVLNQAPNMKISIAGHTDNAGMAEDNQKLSQSRAQAVLEWFAGHGISRERMAAAGFGSTKPIADNKTEQGKALNRRVEIAAEERTN